MLLTAKHRRGNWGQGRHEAVCGIRSLPLHERWWVAECVSIYICIEGRVVMYQYISWCCLFLLRPPIVLLGSCWLDQTHSRVCDGRGSGQSHRCTTCLLWRARAVVYVGVVFVGLSISFIFCPCSSSILLFGLLSLLQLFQSLFVMLPSWIKLCTCI